MNQNDFHNVNWFRDAAPYINQHRGRTFVVFFPGEAINGDDFDSLIHDLALLYALGVKLVLVAGARPQINERLALENISPQYSRGLRITDGASLTAVIEAAGRVRVLVEAKMSLSMVNTPMSGSQIKVCSGNFISARPLGVIDGVDFQHTGEVRKVSVSAIASQLEHGQCVLLSPLGYSPTGEVFNVSAEEVATATACALKADKLIFLSEDMADRTLPMQLTLGELEREFASLAPDAMLRDHLRNARQAISDGVQRCHIIDRHVDGALLTELFTRDGAGILISDGAYQDLRNATINDIAGILELIETLEQTQALVRRSREQLELEFDRFSIIERDGVIIGCAALYPYPDDAMGELACLAVDTRYKGQGLGDQLLNHIQQRARTAQLESLFVLSTKTMHWFRERGFTPGELSELPMKKAALYNYQRNSKIFFKNISQVTGAATP